MKLFTLAVTSCLCLLSPHWGLAQSSSEAPTQDLAEISLKGIDQRLTELTVSPDGKFVAASFGIGRGLLQDPDPGLVMVWESETGKNVFSSRDFIDGVSAVAFTWEGKQLLATGYAGELMIWAAKSFDLIHKHQEQNSGLHCLAVSAGTDNFCFGSINFADDHSYITFMDVNNLGESLRIDAGLEFVWDVGISSDGKLIGAAVSSLKSHVSIWDVGSRTRVQNIMIPRSHPQFRFIPNSQQVLISFTELTVDKRSELWIYDLKEDRAVWKKNGPDGAVLETLLRLNKPFLGVLSRNNTLNIYALNSGKLLETTSAVNDREMAISAKANVVATSRNKKILIQKRSLFPTDSID